MTGTIDVLSSGFYLVVAVGLYAAVGGVERKLAPRSGRRRLYR